MKQEIENMRKKNIMAQRCKESSRSEEQILCSREREELKCQVKVDKGTKTDLQDSFGAWFRICNEVDVILEQKRLREEDLRQCFGRHKDTLEPSARKTEATAEKALQSCQSSKGKHLELNWDSLLSASKQHDDDVATVWKESVKNVKV